jgi:hypothetical protein
MTWSFTYDVENRQVTGTVAGDQSSYAYKGVPGVPSRFTTTAGRLDKVYPAVECACGSSSISRIFPTSVSELNGFGTNGMLRVFSGRSSAFAGYADM